MSSTPPNQNRPFAALRQFIRARAPAEVCELCSAQVPADHQHLIDPLKRKLVCACDACAILFSDQQGSKFRRVPRRVRFLQDFRMTDAQWDNLMIPINMAFFFNSAADQKIVALYPSPAGPTESLLTLESWEEIVQENPILREMEPDVEALLVNRVASARALAEAQYYIVPIDECYKLVGLIRAYWHGLSGGTEVWEAIGKFFTELKERSTPFREASRA
ncbi:MAG TPA: DUF5947 family protein [Blastocatellia bacterium]|nr:DUF5947 family protein [Blastocatellia bacterium]